MEATAALASFSCLLLLECSSNKYMKHLFESNVVAAHGEPSRLSAGKGNNILVNMRQPSH